MPGSPLNLPIAPTCGGAGLTARLLVSSSAPPSHNPPDMGVARVRPGTSGLAFDRRQFQKAVLDRSIQHTQSHRESIVVPIGDPARFQDTVSSRGSISARRLNEDHRIGPQQWTDIGARIKTPRRVPTAHVTEYHTEYNRWAGQLSKPLKECYLMTYNDHKTKQATLVDITKYDRSELRTACAGWGPHMRQVYLPNLSTEEERVHKHYVKQGIGHMYKGADGTARMYGNETVREKPTPRQEPPREATEYRGQYCKEGRGDSDLDRTIHSIDGACDWGMHSDPMRQKIYQRNRRRDATLMNATRREKLMEHQNFAAVVPYAEPTGPVDVPAKTRVGEKDRIGEIGTVHKDMCLETSYVGPCSLSAARSNFHSGTVSPSQDKLTFDLTTRNHRKAHKALVVTSSPEHEAALSPKRKSIGTPTSPTTVQSPRTPQQTVPVSPLTEQRTSVRNGAFVPEHNLPRKTNKIAGWSHKVGSPLRPMDSRSEPPMLGKANSVFAEGRRGTDAIR